MGTRAASIVGEQGPQGPTGSQGAVGPAGFGALTFDPTPDVTPPTANDYDAVWPPGPQYLALGQQYELHVSVRCTNDATKAWRSLVYFVTLTVSEGGATQVNGSQVRNPINSALATWSGTTVVVWSVLMVAAGQYKLRASCAGPNGASGCTWRLKAAEMSALDGVE